MTHINHATRHQKKPERAQSLVDSSGFWCALLLVSSLLSLWIFAGDKYHLDVEQLARDVEFTNAPSKTEGRHWVVGHLHETTRDRCFVVERSGVVMRGEHIWHGTHIDSVECSSSVLATAEKISVAPEPD